MLNDIKTINKTPEFEKDKGNKNPQLKIEIKSFGDIRRKKALKEGHLCRVFP